MISNRPADSIPTILARHRALAVLRLLAGDHLRGRTNEAVLADLLDIVALSGSRDLVRTCLNGLEQDGLVTTSEFRGLLVAQLTGRGAEVAGGRARDEGVAHHVVDGPY